MRFDQVFRRHGHHLQLRLLDDLQLVFGLPLTPLGQLFRRQLLGRHLHQLTCKDEQNIGHSSSNTQQLKSRPMSATSVNKTPVTIAMHLQTLTYLKGRHFCWDLFNYYINNTSVVFIIGGC